MGHGSKMTREEELTAAIAIVRVGLERISDAATRTADVAPHIAALRALRDPSNTDTGVLAALAGTISTISCSLTEVGHANSANAVDHLDTAQAYAQDSVGDRIDRALDQLLPLLVCQECRRQKSDVQVMPDPFTEALYPERDDHDLMPLCHDCAVARFEDS